ncbi:MAG: helix-turn-helix transcriptional regulator [bacterium]
MDGNVKVAGFGPGETVAPGAALRGLRLRAGLSLVELAHLIGRKPGFYSHLSRLEHGRLRRPTLWLVADYLRACPRVARRRACGASCEMREGVGSVRCGLSRKARIGCRSGFTIATLAGRNESRQGCRSRRRRRRRDSLGVLVSGPARGGPVLHDFLT